MRRSHVGQTKLESHVSVIGHDWEAVWTRQLFQYEVARLLNEVDFLACHASAGKKSNVN